MEAALKSPSGFQDPSQGLQTKIDSPNWPHHHHHPAEIRIHIYLPYSKDSVDNLFQVKNLVNQIFGMRGTQPLDFGLPTAKVLYKCNENVDPLATLLGVTKVIHWSALKLNPHVWSSVKVKVFEITWRKFAMVQLKRCMKYKHRKSLMKTGVSFWIEGGVMEDPVPLAQAHAENIRVCLPFLASPQRLALKKQDFQGP